MDENFAPYSEYSNYANLENEFNYDWAVPEYPQPSPFEVNTEIPRDNRDHRDHRGIRDYPISNTTDRVNAKVAIPRNAQSSSWTSSGRVSRACENCREQKAKCSGHRPACHRCLDSNVPCSYGDRKREKMVKQLNDLTTRVETFDALLRDLYPKLDASSAHRVDETLKELNARTPLSQVLSPTPVPALFTNPSGHINQSVLSSDVTPISIPSGAVDYTEEDFDRDEKVQSTGFVGEHSEMAWLYRLKRDLDHSSSKGIEHTLERPSISSVNYFQDDSEILVLDDIDLARRPPQQIANRLVDTYFHVYRSFYANPNVRPGKRWIIVLNLVFAIATRHSFLIDQPQPNCDDHQTYFARAWRLNVEGLAAFYLLSVGQVNRSWRFIGIAIRSAVAMGLNIRSESESITHFSKELRYRVWWALFMLDMVLCETTGRPPGTGDIFCSTPFPVPFAEEDFWDTRVMQIITDKRARNAFFTSLISDTAASPYESVTLRTPEQQESGKGKQEERASQRETENLTPNSSLYFLYAVDLAHLLREAINILYAPRATRQSWLEIETAIPTLNNHADNWLSLLPAEFDFTKLDTTHQFLQQRASLAFQFYATKLIILQPCIRHLSQQSSEASSPGTVCDQMAILCVQMAGRMLDLLPEEPDLTWLYGVAPWWCILHNIMQSTTILLTEMFTRTHVGTAKAVDITKKIDKATRWLEEMSTRDLSSQRAWLVCMDLLSRHGSKFGFRC
ncbi:uncharacterized protein N7525_005326 [Penicillium rubens]|uniref:uncharacterized protein n=1 Tax=Penicillium rubens TaxID=1108849 RepID=UPI002A5A4192|nr:uncharacterized protein N7525_005326 [Penicillium rubens]KAJ5840138.1 hypothetical protein N7525_005326 [Penicillium rubens]